MSASERINNAGNRIIPGWESLKAGPSGGISDQSTDNAKRITGSAEEISSEGSNAAATNLQVNKNNGIEAMQQKTYVAQFNSALDVASSVRF